MNKPAALGVRRLVAAALVATVVTGLLVALTMVGISDPSTGDDTAAVGERSAHESTRPTVTRTSGDSRISIPRSPEVGADGAALRTCARSVPAGTGDGAMITCGAIDLLPDGTMVTMRCWVDGDVSTQDGKAFTVPGWDSPRWFLVTSHGGKHPGWNGYVYSGNIPIDQQVRTPNCRALRPNPYSIGDPHWEFDLEFTVVGTCTTAGGVLHATSAHFTPGEPYTITVVGPDGRAVPVSRRPPVNADGTVAFEWDCQGDQPGIYTVTARDEMTDREVHDAHFVVGNAPPPTVTDSPPPAETNVPVTVTVLNQVTNGPTQMRDDKPTYLSTTTRGSCADAGCALPDTEMTRGDQLTVICQTIGDELTNGERTNPRDDGNPGLSISTVWYRGRWPDGREGYISVVWLVPADRDGRNLPPC